MFFNGGREEFWDSIKETVNFLSNPKRSAGGDKRKGEGDVGGAVKGN
jgi:hypothetical protein